jgi:hypothetical protein
LDIATAIEQGWYLLLDAAETVATFMLNDLPDPRNFLKVTGDFIAEAAKAVNFELARVAACGEAIRRSPDAL